MRLVLPGLALVLVLGALATTDTASAQPGVPKPTFDWEMAPRFGADRDGDGLIEIENTPEDVHNRLPGTCPDDVCADARFAVTVRAQPTPTQLGLPASFLTYEWQLDGPGGRLEAYELGPSASLLLAEGEYDVDLRVHLRLPWGSVTQRARGSLDVDDVLVVALGDSYASGEGSPDRARGDGEAHWADATDAAVAAEHALAHRSTVGWPTRVALALEDASPRSSVTFLNLTSSGARIDRGVIGERSEPPLPAQIDAARAIVGDRPVDLILLQVGGNDVGFSRLIRALVDADPQLDPVCYEVMLDNAWSAVADGRWDRGVRVTFSFPFDIGCESTPPEGGRIPGLEGLGRAFSRLAAALETLEPGRVVLVEYPDPTGSPTAGETCREIVGDVTPPFGFHEVDEQEQAAGIDRLLRPLNETLEEVAAAESWLFVDGVADAFFDGHGYCAEWPNYGYPEGIDESPLLGSYRIDIPEGWYRPPGRFGSPRLLNDGPVSWYRTAAQSAALQGPVPRFLTAGTLHPNEQGHRAIAELVLERLGAGD